MRQGGTITELKGGIPTKEVGVRLIQQAGGIIDRIEGAHRFPNPHTFPHINYRIIETGIKGTLKILGVK